MSAADNFSSIPQMLMQLDQGSDVTGWYFLVKGDTVNNGQKCLFRKMLVTVGGDLHHVSKHMMNDVIQIERMGRSCCHMLSFRGFLGVDTGCWSRGLRCLMEDFFVP